MSSCPACAHRAARLEGRLPAAGVCTPGGIPKSGTLLLSSSRRFTKEAPSMAMQKTISRRQALRFLALGAASSAVLAACGGQAPATTQPSGAQSQATGGGGKLEIFSWWTSGGEVEALNALYDNYKKKYPNV